ncbi:MAG TPA: peptidase U34, partial [Bacteroidetes bacterium]|nr:peptidase U34 [Bacteroidota bacterium]
MCDTLVALHDFTPDGSVLFGKNSDRDPDEAHEIVQIPEQYYPPDQTLKTTYIRIPQVRRT